MTVDRNQLVAGTALVTPEGIIFHDQAFSCRKALREGWFTKGAQVKSWPVHVLYNPGAERHEVIYINSEDFHADYICFVLERSVQPKHAAAYQERVRRLQEERKQYME